MEVEVYDINGIQKDKIQLPKVFETPVRFDIIKKAVLAQQSHRIQPQGRDMMAGQRTTAESRGTGLHLARVPRVKGNRSPRAGQGALATMTIGGRRAHPPKSIKRIYKRINEKERMLAICSAIAATAKKELVSSRRHSLEKVQSLPIIISDDFQKISKTSEAKQLFEALGLTPDIIRVKKSVKIRAGRGTMRGRKKRYGRGPLFIISDDKGIGKAIDNFLGVDIIKINQLNAEALAPGTKPGRLTVWAISAINKVDSLFKR